MPDFTILIVDDDPMTLRLASQLIERFGWIALQAASGEDALEQMTEHGGDIDLVLLDLAMPRLDGFEVASRIRNDFQLTELPIIALTARVEHNVHAKALNAGIDHIIAKPFDVDKLQQTLQSFLT